MVLRYTLKATGMKSQKLSDDLKIDAHKSVSDAKIAIHEAGCEIEEGNHLITSFLHKLYGI
jgi:hypothetical protein